jgi:hypothetical protein
MTPSLQELSQTQTKSTRWPSSSTILFSRWDMDLSAHPVRPTFEYWKPEPIPSLTSNTLVQVVANISCPEDHTSFLTTVLGFVSSLLQLPQNSSRREPTKMCNSGTTSVCIFQCLPSSYRETAKNATWLLPPPLTGSLHLLIPLSGILDIINLIQTFISMFTQIPPFRRNYLELPNSKPSGNKYISYPFLAYFFSFLALFML